MKWMFIDSCIRGVLTISEGYLGAEHLLIRITLEYPAPHDSDLCLITGGCKCFLLGNVESTVLNGKSGRGCLSSPLRPCSKFV